MMKKRVTKNDEVKQKQEKEFDNKKLFFICFIIFSFVCVSSLVYINFFINKISFVNADLVDEVPVFQKYNYDKVTACYGNKLICKKIKVIRKGTININKVGTYTINYSASRGSEKKSINKKVKVIDKIAPELSVEADFNNVCPNGKISNATYSALDNYDGDISKNIESKIEGNKIIYRVEDSSGNTTKKEFNININDNEKPSLILNGDKTIYLGVGSKYKEPGYAAVDNCDGTITDKVEVSNTVDTSKEGTYTLTYSVKDNFGNIQTEKRTIKVFKRNAYTPQGLSGKVIYLTFDDGPGAYTERLLNILQKYNVKVTFFVTGQNGKFNYLMKREHDEGHTVALHSYTHSYPKIYSSVESYMSDLTMVQNIVKEQTGIESKIIRFPGGSSNTVSRRYSNGIMSTLTKKVEELGYRYFDWNISSGDAGNTTSSSQIIKNVTYNLTSGNNNVVLMHDIKSYTVDAVESIIQYGLSNGYVFAPLTMESPVVHQKVNN